MTKPSDFKDMNLSNLFGKVEIEHAVEFIINRCINMGDSWETPVNIYYFETESELLHGFSYLLYGDWMEEDGSGNNFVVSEGLIKKLEERKNGLR